MQGQSTWDLNIENRKAMAELIVVPPQFIRHNRSLHTNKHKNNNQLNCQSWEKHLRSLLGNYFVLGIIFFKVAENCQTYEIFTILKVSVVLP